MCIYKIFVMYKPTFESDHVICLKNVFQNPMCISGHIFIHVVLALSLGILFNINNEFFIVNNIS